MVFVRRGGTSTPLAPQYEGPFKVVARGPKTFHLQMGDRIEVVSVDRLKPFTVLRLLLLSLPVEASLLVRLQPRVRGWRGVVWRLARRNPQDSYEEMCEIISRRISNIS